MGANQLFKKLYLNSVQQKKEQIKKVLILYEDEIHFLGDCCIRFDKFKYFKSLLNNAFIHINFSNPKNEKFYKGLLFNNPFIDNISSFMDWEQLAFEEYDVVFSVSSDEQKLLDFLHRKYGDSILNDTLKMVVYSISDLLLKKTSDSRYIFPVNREMNLLLKVPKPGELYLAREEMSWGDAWLEKSGIRQGEKLFVMLDSTAVRQKLIDLKVYFEIIDSLLEKHHNARILVFDEGGIGKASFYMEWLSPERMDRLIFSRGLTLREDLCLLGSSYVSLIFGPCTGLMHCSSSIYNSYVSRGLNLEHVPLMIVYAGSHGINNYDINLWWRDSPLINCLLLQLTDHKKELRELKDLSYSDTIPFNFLPCSAYTAELLMDFIGNKLPHQPFIHLAPSIVQQ